MYPTTIGLLHTCRHQISSWRQRTRLGRREPAGHKAKQFVERNICNDTKPWPNHHDPKPKEAQIDTWVMTICMTTQRHLHESRGVLSIGRLLEHILEDRMRLDGINGCLHLAQKRGVQAFDIIRRRGWLLLLLHRSFLGGHFQNANNTTDAKLNKIAAMENNYDHLFGTHWVHDTMSWP